MIGRDDFPLVHGAQNLPGVSVDAYSTELRENGEFVGDLASKGALTSIIEEARKRQRRLGDDPLGDLETGAIDKKTLDKILAEGPADAAGLVHGAVEDFAQRLAAVVSRFLALKGWQGTERIVIGGGLRRSRVGQLAIGRSAILLREDGIKIELAPIRHDPDDAGLLGALHLAPSWMVSGHDAILAVDIGGTNIRAGIVSTGGRKRPDPSKAGIVCLKKWSHADADASRTEAVDRLIAMLNGLVKHADNKKLSLAPLIGVGCPGIIRSNGTIEHGGQNLPGRWESPRFCLPARLKEGVDRIGEQEPFVLMHNDAVVQGLSERPWMEDVEHWGVLTLGTGLGNARFTNMRSDKD